MNFEPIFPGLAARDSRTVSIRYFNLYRIIVASILMLFGGVLSFGQRDPQVFAGAVLIYWALALTFLLLHATQPRFGERTYVAQVVLDICLLGMLMFASGGYRSGMPFLMMISVAGAGLVGRGRAVQGAAALAAIVVLIEQMVRVLQGDGQFGEFTQVGIIGAGFFSVAALARMLARRALVNEALARKRGEDLARQMRINARIISDMQEGVVVIDKDGLIRQVNPSAERLLEASLEPGRPLVKLVPEFEQLPVLDNLAAERGTMSVQSGGRIRHLQVRSLMTGEQGDMILYVEDLASAHARAQQIKLAALGRLTANIAHEIRNPLSSVSHASELLLEEKRSDVQARLVRIIHDNAARIERIIRDVMELGRRDRVMPELFDLDEFCRMLIDERAERTGQQDMVRMECPPGIRIRFDRLHLYRIVGNLLDNACRHGSGGPGSVVIGLRGMDAEASVLFVRDDGPGIPASDRSKVFEPFFTSHASGTGLGLYIARELAEANGSSLELGNAEGGAEFLIGIRRAS